MFYHLTASGLEETAAGLLVRAMGAGWRVMVRGTDDAALDRLDARLWEVPADGFLPHGRERGMSDGDQPVLLGTGAVPDGAKALMVVDGAEVSVAEAGALERVWILFDGNDPDATEVARGQWRRLGSAGIAAQYWSDAEGRWALKHRSG